MFFRSLLPALLLGHNGRRKRSPSFSLYLFFASRREFTERKHTEWTYIYYTRTNKRSQKRVTQKRKELINESIYLLPTNGVIPGDHGIVWEPDSNVCVSVSYGQKRRKRFWSFVLVCIARLCLFVVPGPKKVTVKSTFNTLRMFLFVVTMDLPHARVCVCVCVCIFVCPVAFHLFFFSLTYNPRTCLFFCVPLFGSIENGKDVHKNTIASFENIFVFFFCQTKNE